MFFPIIVKQSRIVFSNMREFLNYIRSNLRNSIKEGVIIFYPFLLFFIYSFSLINNPKQLLKENISVFFSALIMFSLYLLFRHWKRKTFLILLYIIFASGIFLKTGFYILYGSAFSASAVFIIFETNLYEAIDFVEFYMNPKLFFLLFLLLIPLGFIIFLKQKKTFLSNRKAFNLLLLSTILISSVLILLKFEKEHILGVSFHAYKDYREVKKRMISDFSDRISPGITNLQQDSIPEEEIHIVIIGESTTSRHMQLYGYKKETNPLLKEIDNELFIFNSVISPHTHTILSLEKMLTLSNYENPIPEKNASVVQLVNQAGYTTYWVSNQRPMGFHESVSTNIAKAATKKYFTTSNEYGFQETKDDVIFPVLKTIMKEPDKKKVIFIQLIGTHSPYSKRYPSEFSKFDSDKDLLLFPSENAQKIRNEYDNAILYNDFILRSIIEILRKTNTYGSLTYFSDHGEDVFETMDFVGHNEYHATKPMYEIPFIIWLSEKYNNRHHERIPSAYLQRRYNAEDFIFTLADLLSIDFDENDISRSIINSNFKSRTRWIKEVINYDNREE